MSQQGSRIGGVFKGMLTTCPMEIGSYAACLMKSESVEKGICEKEFQALKSCFRKVRRAGLKR